MNGFSAITTEETAAVVVGIEAYTHQPDWPVPGAAAAAEAFAQWLEKHGVSRVARLITRDAKDPKASYNAISQALFTTVKAWKEQGVRLLFVYWAGHGILDEQDDARLLLCDDARRDDPQPIAFDDYRRAMRDRAFPPYQVFVVDACARRWGRIKPGRAAPSRERPAHDCRQFVIFSTSVDEVSQAATVSADPGPVALAPFAAALRGALARSGASWPPDIPAIATEVQQSLAAAGADQRPRIHSVGWDGDVTDPGAREPKAMLPFVFVERLGESLSALPGLADRERRATLLRELTGSMAYGLKADSEPATFGLRLAQNTLAAPPELGELFEAFARQEPGQKADAEEELAFFRRIDDLFSVRISWRDVVRLLRILSQASTEIDADRVWDLATGLAKDFPAALQFPLSAFRRPGLAAAVLAQLSGKGKPPPLLSLAVHLAAHASEPTRAALMAWATGAAAAAGVDVPDPPPGGDPTATPVRLSVVLFPHEAELFEVRVWRWEDAQARELTASENRLPVDRIARLINDYPWRDDEAPAVELFMPTRQMAEGLAAWELDVTASSRMRIDEQFPVSLRSFERSFGSSGDFKAPARQAWRDRWARRPGSGCLSLGHIADLFDAADYDLRSMVKNHRPKGPVTVAASFVPPGADRTVAERVLHNLLVAGMPIAVWPEPGSVGTAAACEIHKALRDFVSAEALDRLPNRVYRHQSGLDPGPPADWRLCLLWDDPSNVPKPRPLTQPAAV